MTWTRRLNPKFKENPENLGDGVPGYFIHILHIIPNPVPKDVSQEYQVVKILVLTIDENCKLDFETIYKLDIVDITGRTEIADRLGLDYREKKYCVVWEIALHTIGFGSTTKEYEEVANETISEVRARRIIGEMTEPITRFSTLYAFSEGDCCMDLLQFFGVQPRRRDNLRVEGLGDFPKPKPPKPPKPPPEPPPPIPPAPPPLPPFFASAVRPSELRGSDTTLITLAQAETLHELIGESAISVGLRARYLGQLAEPVDEGQSPLFQPAVWAIVRRNEPDDDFEKDLVLAGEELFRISLAPGGEATASESWTLMVGDSAVRVHVGSVTKRGRTFLGPFRAKIGAV